MEQRFIVNADGELVDVILSDTVVQLDEGFRIIEKPWPDGMYKPKHNIDTDEWESGETPEEKAEREAAAAVPPPEPVEQKLSRFETELADIKKVNAANLLNMAQKEIDISNVKKGQASVMLILAKNNIK